MLAAKLKIKLGAQETKRLLNGSSLEDAVNGSGGGGNGFLSGYVARKLSRQVKNRAGQPPSTPNCK
jgi:hypothetical protein